MPETVISTAGHEHLLFALTDGVGPITFGRMLMHFGDAAGALRAARGDLERIHGVGPQTAGQILAQRDEVRRGAEAEIEAAAALGVRILCRADAEYPEGLRQLPDPPIVLYVRGALRPTDAIALAIVGTRRCTIYGSEQARRFGELAAQAGLTVVSGLARGIDSFAQHGAVDAGGRSIAVMGGGLDQVYPPENEALARKLLAHGAWVAEIPLHAAVRRENFPSRNRIIAGMSLGTLVVEAPARSGALITARFASEYNREVFAIPGRVQDPQSIGTNRLIRDGAAKLVTCLEDILDELGEVGRKLSGALPSPPARAPGDLGLAVTASPSAPGDAHLTAAESRVLDVIGYDPLLQDAVIAAAELPTGEVLAAFTSLELKGLIRRLPGQLVARRGRA